MASEIKVIYPGRVAIFHELLSERAWSQRRNWADEHQHVRQSGPYARPAYCRGCRRRRANVHFHGRGL